MSFIFFLGLVFLVSALAFALQAIFYSRSRWMGDFNNSKRALKADPNILGIYQCVDTTPPGVTYARAHNRGALYVFKNRISFQQNGKTHFDIPVSKIKQMNYSKWGVEFVEKDSTIHALQSILAVSLLNAFSYSQIYNQLGNHVKSRDDLKEKIKFLNIPIEKHDTTKRF